MDLKKINPIKGQSQNSLETAPGSHTKQSTGIAKVDLRKSPPKPLKRLPIEEQLDQASETLLLDILEGRDIAQSGATGKRYKGPANLALKTKAAELWLARRRPTLTATAVKAIENHDTRPPVSALRARARGLISGELSARDLGC